MANILDSVLPHAYAGMHVAAREFLGLIPAVSRDASVASAAIGDKVTSPIVLPAATENIVPGETPASSGDHTVDKTEVTMSKAKAYPIRYTGEEQLSLKNAGTGQTIMAQQFALAFRTLSNEIEADLAGLYTKFARAYGTPGTTPFAVADDMTDLAEVNRLLDEQGAPKVGRQMIFGSSAKAKLEAKQSHLFKVNEAGDAGAMLREREMRKLSNFIIGDSSAIGRVGATSAASGYQVNNGAGYAAGSKSIAIDTGTGAIGAGEVVKFAGYDDWHVVGTGGTTSVDLNYGLKAAVADDAAVTNSGLFVPNMAFHSAALMLATRAPAMPEGGDSADDVTIITDPYTGLSFQLAVYRQYRQVKMEVGIAWGVAAPNPHFTALLLG